jgi:hypothetical protein
MTNRLALFGAYRATLPTGNLLTQTVEAGISYNGRGRYQLQILRRRRSPVRAKAAALPGRRQARARWRRSRSRYSGGPATTRRRTRYRCGRAGNSARLRGRRRRKKRGISIATRRGRGCRAIGTDNRVALVASAINTSSRNNCFPALCEVNSKRVQALLAIMSTYGDVLFLRSVATESHSAAFSRQA